MALYQYKVDDYGKVCYDEDLERRHKFLTLQASPLKIDKLEKLDYEFYSRQPVEFYRRIDGIFSNWTSSGPAVQKYILFELDRKTLGNPKYKFLTENYIKVLTENPKDPSDHPRQLKFWVREDWVEPLEGKKTYEEDICLRLLKKLKAK